VVCCPFPRFGRPHLLSFTVWSSVWDWWCDILWTGTTAVTSAIWSPVMRASEHCFSYVCVRFGNFVTVCFKFSGWKHLKYVCPFSWMTVYCLCLYFSDLRGQCSSKWCLRILSVPQREHRYKINWLMLFKGNGYLQCEPYKTHCRIQNAALQTKITGISNTCKGLRRIMLLDLIAFILSWTVANRDSYCQILTALRKPVCWYRVTALRQECSFWGQSCGVLYFTTLSE
jgi:hypothetical protein